jgi:hypothetical protein
LAFYLAHREEYADKAEKYRPLQKLTRDTLLDASSADIVKKFIASYEDF